MKPLKYKKTEYVDIKKSVLEYARDRYYVSNRPQNIEVTLDNFNRHRQDLVAALNDSDQDYSNLLAKHLTWLKDILALQNQLPLDRDPSISGKSLETENILKINFTWSNSLQEKDVATSSNVTLETSSVMFNIAILYINMSMRKLCEDDDDVKEAVKLFKMAASIVSYLKKILCEKLSWVLADVSNEALSLLLSLCLAQAQTLIYEKGLKDKCSRSLLSKLSFKVSEWYEEASTYAGKMPNFFEPIFRRWLKVQRLAFLSVSHYSKAIYDLNEASKKSDGYGVVISRLRLSHSYYLQAEKLHSSEILTDLSVLESNTKSLLDRLEKDNKSIYWEVIPDSSTLTPLQSVTALAADKTFQPKDLISGRNVQDSDILCFEIQDVDRILELFDKKVLSAKYLTSSIKDTMEDFNGYIIREGLMYLCDENIFSSSVSALPDNLRSKIIFAQERDSVSESKDILEKIEDAAKSSCSMVQSIKFLITQHQNNEEKYNKYFDERVGVKPRLRRAGRNFREVLKAYEDKLESAIRANFKIRKLYTDYVAPYEHTLSLTIEEIEDSWKQFPVQSDVQRLPEKSRESLSSIKSDMDKIKQLNETICTEEVKIQGLIESMKKNLRVTLTKEFFIHTSRKEIALNGEFPNKENTSFENFGTSRVHQAAEKLITHNIMEKHKSNCSKLITHFESMKRTLEENLERFRYVSETSKIKYLKELESAVTAMNGICNDGQDGLTFFRKLDKHLKNLFNELTESVANNQEPSLTRYDFYSSTLASKNNKQVDHPAPVNCAKYPLLHNSTA